MGASLDGGDEAVYLTMFITLTEHSLVEILVKGDFVDYVAVNLIRRAEMHEMDEWLKLDGVCVKDPHPETVKAEYSFAKPVVSVTIDDELIELS